MVSKIDLRLGNCLELMKAIPDKSIDAVITDPPYNIGYKYNGYSDNLSEQEYIDLLSVIHRPAVVIHYPEQTINILPKILGMCNETVAWVYNSRIQRQHRIISWWGLKPDFTKVRVPYLPATVSDKRNQHKFNELGRSLPDWWNVQYINNMSLEKTDHPCQIPQSIMERIILISTDKDDTILDPFMGSGTTGVACVKLNRNFIGIEINPQYFEIAQRRIAEAQAQLSLF